MFCLFYVYSSLSVVVVAFFSIPFQHPRFKFVEPIRQLYAHTNTYTIQSSYVWGGRILWCICDVACVACVKSRILYYNICPAWRQTHDAWMGSLMLLHIGMLLVWRGVVWLGHKCWCIQPSPANYLLLTLRSGRCNTTEHVWRLKMLNLFTTLVEVQV